MCTIIYLKLQTCSIRGMYLLGIKAGCLTCRKPNLYFQLEIAFSSTPEDAELNSCRRLNQKVLGSGSPCSAPRKTQIRSCHRLYKVHLSAKDVSCARRR